jgi:pyruvate dehydrogenase E1 component beta subunit
VDLPIVLRTMFGTGLGAGAHHSQSLEAWFVHTPGLKVVMPSTPYDAKGLMLAAIRDDNPVIYMEHKALYPLKGEIPEEEYIVPIGEAEIKRSGSDVTIVATGLMVHTALEAADDLAGEGVAAEVIDPRTLSPLDKESILDSVKKTNHLVIIQEAPKICGFAAEVAAMVAEEALDFLDAPVKRLSFPFMPVPFGDLEKSFLPQKGDLVAAVKDVIA